MNIQSNRFRFFHLTEIYNKNLDSINPDINKHPDPDRYKDQDKNSNKNLNINNSSSNLPSNIPSNSNSNPTNSQSLINIKAVDDSKQQTHNEFKHVTIPFLELTQINFLSVLFLNLTLKSINTILFQYTSYQEGNFYMLGPQVGANVGETHDLNSYRNIFEHYKETLRLLMDRYQLDEPDFITIRIKSLHIEENLQITKQNLSSIDLQKGLVKVERMKTNFNSKILPYMYKEKYFGYLLMNKLRQDYITDLIALLEKNNLNVTTRTEYQKYIPIESANNEKE
jgi:hypothetical protein